MPARTCPCLCLFVFTLLLVLLPSLHRDSLLSSELAAFRPVALGSRFLRWWLRDVRSEGGGAALLQSLCHRVRWGPTRCPLPFVWVSVTSGLVSRRPGWLWDVRKKLTLLLLLASNYAAGLSFKTKTSFWPKGSKKIQMTFAQLDWHILFLCFQWFSTQFDWLFRQHLLYSIKTTTKNKAKNTAIKK